MLVQWIIILIIHLHMFGLNKKKYARLFFIPVILFLVPAIQLFLFVIIPVIITPELALELDPTAIGRVFGWAIINCTLFTIFHNSIIAYLNSRNSKSKDFIFLYGALLIIGILSLFTYGVLYPESNHQISSETSSSSQKADDSSHPEVQSIYFSDLLEIKKSALLYNTDTFVSLKKQVRVITDESGIKTLIIEGYIRKGLIDVVWNTIQEHEGQISKVALFSEGGDAIEAIKIGHLIRDLNLETEAPRGSKSRPQCDAKYGIDPNNCNCSSSCFLIYASGISRSGFVIGVHRIYVNHEILKNLSYQDAIKHSETARQATTNYLRSMDIPQNIIDKTFATDSSTIKYLDEKDLEQVNGYIPQIAEWIISKCGNFNAVLEKTVLTHAHKDDLLKKYNQNQVNTILNESKTEALETIDCRNKISQIMAKNAFEEFNSRVTSLAIADNEPTRKYQSKSIPIFSVKLNISPYSLEIPSSWKKLNDKELNSVNETTEKISGAPLSNKTIHQYNLYNAKNDSVAQILIKKYPKINLSQNDIKTFSAQDVDELDFAFNQNVIKESPILQKTYPKYKLVKWHGSEIKEVNGIHIFINTYERTDFFSENNPNTTIRSYRIFDVQNSFVVIVSVRKDFEDEISKIDEILSSLKKH